MDSELKKENEKKRSLMSWVVKKERKKRRKQEQSKYGDGMAWFRGCLLGKGCFGSVYVANLKKPKSRYSSYPPIMAVKSAEVSVSSSIQKEREVLNNLRGCRNVIRCFGEEITTGENGEMVYNLLLEYGSGGTLADLIIKSGPSGLPESEVKRHTRSILHGLRHIHRNGYVHCDLKPENILLVATSSSSDDDRFIAKIGDLGLAKRAKKGKKSVVVCYGRGTSMYFSPEILSDGVQEAPSDIWAFGCIVLEMFTGNPPKFSPGNKNEESHLIPSSISREGRSFLKGCFSRKACYRWTAEMLLAHPFLEGVGNNDDAEDDDRVEELGEVLDINAISSLIMSEEEDDDDEISMLSFSDDLSYVSEDELLDCWSDEDVSCFSVEESGATVPLNEVHQYPIALTISSGV